MNTVFESAGNFTSSWAKKTFQENSFGVRDLRFSCGVAEDSRRYVAGELNLPLVFLCLSCAIRVFVL